MRKLTKMLIFAILFMISSILLLIISSSTLEITNYVYESDRVPESFDSYKIVQLSDFHCKNFGKHNDKLIQAINSLEPDIIVFTGDMIDGSHTDITPLQDLLEGIYLTAPVYAISGNHEFDKKAPYTEMLDLYEQYGVINLDDASRTITLGTDSILLKGLHGVHMKVLYDKQFLTLTDDTFSIILNHYANQFDVLAPYQYDLILSGHLHGGVIRLPYFGGVIGNGGSFFPEYASGSFTLGRSTMFVSRGLGDTVIPRIHNNPEIVCITLHNPASNN